MKDDKLYSDKNEYDSCLVSTYFTYYLHFQTYNFDEFESSYLGYTKKIPPYPIFSFEVGESRLCISVILRFENSCNGVELLSASDNDIVRSVVKLDRKVTTVDVSEMVERNDLPTGWLTTCLQQILECTNRMKENRLNERALVKEHSLRNFDNVSMRARS